MEVYEYYGQVAEDGYLTLPDELKGRLTAKSKVRVMLFLEDEEFLWKKMAAEDFLRGYAEEDRIYDEL